MADKASVLTIRVPAELKERIETVAELQGVSINQFALYAFTKQLSELETSDYFKQFIKSKSKTEILNNFDAVMKKVQNCPVESWDELSVAEDFNGVEIKTKPDKNVKFSDR